MLMKTGIAIKTLSIKTYVKNWHIAVVFLLLFSIEKVKSEIKKAADNEKIIFHYTLL